MARNKVGMVYFAAKMAAATGLAETKQTKKINPNANPNSNPNAYPKP